MVTSRVENNLHRHSKIFDRIGFKAWASWLSKSNLRKLETAQLNPARAITGHLRSTPGEFVLKEAHLTPLEARYKTVTS